MAREVALTEQRQPLALEFQTSSKVGKASNRFSFHFRVFDPAFFYSNDERSNDIDREHWSEKGASGVSLNMET